ncbi:hypothetical protein [Actinoplanes sp. GCM10030250]|uniref:NACHT and WD40 repeat domain-containing protein n=1 Tax=Actinoplanes sp. GCM10030250 TaxID=3273376 RepID=UPI00360A3E6E
MTALVIAFLVRADNETGAVVTAVAGLVLAAASTLIDLVAYLRSAGTPVGLPEQADALAAAAERQWAQEADARGLSDGDVLPLSWRRRDDDLPASPGAVARRDAGGRLVGDFDSVIRELATGFHTIPGRRMVLLGEPGAGKTVVGLMLTLGLLKVRAAGGPVPFFLSISSWDPVVQSMDDWLIRSIAESYYGGNQETARRLLQSGMIVPILDGLDEIPDSSRRHAIGEINRAVRHSRPVVVTCRLNEYRELIVDGSPTLSQAPVLAVQPITLDDLIRYYAQLRWPPGVSWSRVFQRMGDEPDGALATAFSTPLIISLARLIMTQGGETPDDLLDDPSLESRHSLENWLTSKTVQAAYTSREQPTPRERRRRSRAERHLGYLAQHMHAQRERELTWWLLSDRVLPPWFSPILGLAGGLVSMVTVVAAYALLVRGSATPAGVLVFAAAVGLVFAILLTTAWSMTGKRPPRQLLLRSHDAGRRWRAGFRSGAVAVLLPAGALLVTFVLFISIGDTWSFENLLNLTRALVTLTAVGVTSGVVTGVLRSIEGAHDEAWTADPPELLRRDRRSSLVCSVLGGLLFGGLMAPFAVLGLWVGGVGLGLLSRWPGWPGGPDVHAVFDATYFEVATRYFRTPQLAVAALFVLPGVGFAILILITRCWPRFVVTCAVLAAAGRLPLNLSAFLDDAYRRGVLRRSGGLYQFRHGRLQEHLALGRAANRRPLEGDGVQVKSARRTRAAYALTAVLVLLASLSAVMLPRSNSLLTLRGQYAKGPYDVTFSPSGALVALRSERDPLVHVFDITNGESKGTFPGHLSQGEDASIAFSPTDGAIAVTHRTDSTNRGVTIWDLASGTRKVELPLRDGRYIDTRAKFSADGTTVAIFGPRARGQAQPTMTLWDLPAGRPALEVPYDHLSPLRMSPDRSTFMSFRAGLYVLRRMSDGRGIAALGRVDPDSPSHFSSDGKRLFVNSSGQVVLWNTQTGVAIFRSRTAYFAQLNGTAFFSADSRTAVVVDGLDAKILDATDGHTLQRLRLADIENVAISTDGFLTALVAEDGRLLTLERTGRTRRYAGLPRADPEKIARLPLGGRFLVATASGGSDARAFVVKVFDTRDGRLLWSETGVGVESFNGADDDYAGTSYPPEPADDTSATIALRTGRKTIEFRRLADGGRTFEILNPDLVATSEVELPCCTFMTDRLVVRRDLAPAEHTLTVYDTTSGRTVARITDVTGEPLIVAGKIVSAGSDHVIRVRNLLNGKVLATLRGHTDGIESLEMTPDGKHLASSSRDGSVRIWAIP